MKSGTHRAKLLGQLLLVLLLNSSEAGNLDFYQDVEPDLPQDVGYKEIARYLESRNQEARELQRNRLSPELPWSYTDYVDYRRQKEKILESLLENPDILDVLGKTASKNREEAPEWQRAFDAPEDYSREQLSAGPPAFMSVNPSSVRYEDYVNRVPFTRNVFKNEKNLYGPSDDESNDPFQSGVPESRSFSLDEAANRLPKLRAKLVKIELERQRANEEKSASGMMTEKKEPEFTFKFNEEPPRANDKDAFAIRPNDLRYYAKEDGSSISESQNNQETTSLREGESGKEAGNQEEEVAVVKAEEKSEMYPEESDVSNRDKFSLMRVVMPDGDSYVVTSTRMTNNDIYFIAIVAGCSAAAMFALVLIALTWCRLHRGAKAAADIEYPAYGVTGPNRDVSPSGDQRLAHSAQMYHFQHQKQQIIAMENRTAASRDPGSVSEAESDEENEEGDYTVYECPGLASTGEMEVKNPMFLDDPTPATPPQIHKDEDHM